MALFFILRCPRPHASFPRMLDGVVRIAFLRKIELRREKNAQKEAAK
jgi:hypothetical protein